MREALTSGIDLRGYFAWSLMDNFEWMSGYRMRFGMVRNNYITQKRHIKLSGAYYRDCIAARRVIASSEPMANPESLRVGGYSKARSHIHQARM